jgi:hypothetical protein
MGTVLKKHDATEYHFLLAGEVLFVPGKSGKDAGR